MNASRYQEYRFYLLRFLFLFYFYFSQTHLYAVVPPLGCWCLRLLVLPDLTQVGLPP